MHFRGMRPIPRLPKLAHAAAPGLFCRPLSATSRARNLVVLMLDVLDGEEVLQLELEPGEVLCLGGRVDHPKSGVNEPER